MRLRTLKAMLGIALFAWALWLHASEALETKSFREVCHKALSLKEKYGVENVLLVFDIDNTLLAMEGQLGSDQWFTWQSGLLKKTPKPSDAVVSNFEELLDVQGQLFAVAETRPTQRKLPKMVQTLQKEGFQIVLLTSRSKQYFDSTVRSLSQNRFDFSTSALPCQTCSGEAYMPYEPDRVEAFGLKEADADRFGLEEPRPVIFREGLYMTAGQHKGAMLRLLLEKSEQSFSAILFVDDHSRHVLAMQDAFKDTGTECITYRYGREDKHVEAFKSSDKTEVTQQWRRWRVLLEELFH